MMNKLQFKIEETSVNITQAQQFLSQTREHMRKALEDDLASEAGLNQMIAVFEELRRRSEKVIELRRTNELLRSLENSKE